ncbi:MAG: hypothetical protein WCF36_12750 [Candidatus Nanopelagicales bacterium]
MVSYTASQFQPTVIELVGEQPPDLALDVGTEVGTDRQCLAVDASLR